MNYCFVVEISERLDAVKIGVLLREAGFRVIAAKVSPPYTAVNSSPCEAAFQCSVSAIPEPIRRTATAA